MFKQFFDIIKFDLLQLCEDFYFKRANVEIINCAIIAIIPKVETLETSVDYRSINLIYSSLKILSKLLANPLSNVMNSPIYTNQYVFLKGRCILDNIATAEELISSIYERRLQGHILKVDFVKAFDFVDWNFLFDLLKA